MLNILFLCNKPPVGRDANTIVDHIQAFEDYSKHRIWICSGLYQMSKKLDLEKFDVIIIHYSLFILGKTYLTRAAIKRLRDYQGMKVIFIQDEYRRIHEMVDTLQYLKMDVLFTCFPEAEFDNIYPPQKLPHLSKYNNLTGYVPKRLTEYTGQPNISTRPLHVGYRGRQLPFWYGELGTEKSTIVDKWHKAVPEGLLKTDISCRETDRIYGGKWIEFLSSCKTTLGVESGTSVMDFTGEIEKAVEHHQLFHPNDTFEKVQRQYFLAEEGKHKLNQISPRCFEAIALKTVLVLYEGEYSGILEPGRHYIALKKDFSNIDEVLKCIQDDDFLQNMADTAFKEIALNPLYSYETFVKRVDDILEHEFVERSKARVVSLYDEAIFVKHAAHRTLRLQDILAFYQRLPLPARLVVKAILKPHSFLKSVIRSLKKKKLVSEST